MSLARYSIRFDPTEGPPQKIVFRPCDRPGAGYIRVEKEWDGCHWRVVGSEPVDDVRVTGRVQQQSGSTTVGP